jgi:TPR repeat protein
MNTYTYHCTSFLNNMNSSIHHRTSLFMLFADFVLCRPGKCKSFFLGMMILCSTQYSHAQGNMNNPKPVKRTTEYQGRGSGHYIQELRQADIDFDNGSYLSSSAAYINYEDSLDKEQHDRLGWLYYMGYGVTKDNPKAVTQFELAAKENLAQAFYYLGTLKHVEVEDMYDGKEHILSVKYFQQAAELGDPEGMNAVGLELEQDMFKGRPTKAEILENGAKLVKWYGHAAQLGSSNGMVNLGNCYSDGIGVKKNKDSAFRWYRESANLGNSQAMYNLGIEYTFGKGAVRKNYDSAFKWYRLAAENGSAYAMTNIGSFYEHGTGVKVDYNEAVKWYQKGVEGGDGMAASNLGHMYNFGLGVKKNVDTAMSWYDRAETMKKPVLNKD